MPTAPRKRVNRGDISEMMGWPRNDLRNFRKFLCEPTQLRIWSAYLSRKEPNRYEKGPGRKRLVFRAVQAIQHDEEKFTVVRLAQDNRQEGRIWEGKNDGDLEAMCETAAEIMNVLSLEFSGKRSATSATMRRMKDMALIKGINLEGGAIKDALENRESVRNRGVVGLGRHSTKQKTKVVSPFTGDSGNGHASHRKSIIVDGNDSYETGYYEEEDIANVIESEVPDASDGMEHYEQYTVADGINMFMLGLIIWFGCVGSCPVVLGEKRACPREDAMDTEIEM